MLLILVQTKLLNLDPRVGFLARPGQAWFGLARPGWAWPGLARPGQA